MACEFSITVAVKAKLMLTAIHCLLYLLTFNFSDQYLDKFCTSYYNCHLDSAVCFVPCRCGTEIITQVLFPGVFQRRLTNPTLLVGVFREFFQQ